MAHKERATQAWNCNPPLAPTHLLQVLNKCNLTGRLPPSDALPKNLIRLHLPNNDLEGALAGAAPGPWKNLFWLQAGRLKYLAGRGRDGRPWLRGSVGTPCWGAANPAPGSAPASRVCSERL